MNHQYPTHFGSGWISGILSTTLGAMGLGGVFCLLFPQWLTMPELRAVYPMELIRWLIHLVLVSAFVLGFISIILRKNKILGLIGLISATLAVLLGGSQVPVPDTVTGSKYLGLDWFLLELFFLSLLFVQLERLFGRLKEQEIFRRHWNIDLIHFVFSHLAVQLTVFLSMLPAKVFFTSALNARLQQAVASQIPENYVAQPTYPFSSAVQAGIS